MSSSAAVAPIPTTTGSGKVSTPLLKEEHMYTNMMAGIVTCTFLRGGMDDGVAAMLQGRLVNIARKNPWLCGHLAKGSPTHTFHFPDPETAARTAISRCFKAVPYAEAQLSVDMPYADLARTLKPYATQQGSKLLDQLDEPIFKVNVFDCAEGDMVCVHVDLSHVVADGSTYYAVFNMLSEGAEITALNAQRKMDLACTGAAFKAKVGNKEASMSFGMGYMCNMLCAMKCGPKRKARAYSLNMDRIAAAKNRVDKSKVDFVSTNDVVTSELGRVFRPRLLEMAMDLRPHLEGLDKTDAGMYVGNLFFVSKDDYGTPEAVRFAVVGGRARRAGHLVTGKGKESPLPGCCGTCCGKLTLVSNWATGAADMVWGNGVEQVLHIPLEAQMPVDAVIVFKSKPGQWAVLVFSSKALQFADSTTQFGELLAPKMFA